MSSTDFLSLSLGIYNPYALQTDTTTRLVRALQPAPHINFANPASVVRRPPPLPSRFPQRRQDRDDEEDEAFREAEQKLVAHQPGVNALAVDKFEGRYAISGGADGGIAMWDLEAADHPDPAQPQEPGEPRFLEHHPLGYAPKSQATHTHGVTGLSFYPFDSLAFISSSYDHTLKIFDSNTLVPSASFDLSSNVYAHAMSPIAQHLMVACALQHPAVRLVDLKSGAATHTLAGHGGGAVLSVAWSPTDEHVMASGATDGTVRFWDIRRSAGTLGVLDMDDSIGVVGYSGRGQGARSRHRGKAHAGPVNGIVWTEDARYLVTTGHDERIRVWDMHTGANTLASFGPAVRNRNLASLVPVIAPRGFTRHGDDVLFFPNQKDILQFELFEGRMLKKLRPLGAPARNHKEDKLRVSALAWRAHDVEMLSAHGDGVIRSWRPRTTYDAMLDEQEKLEDAGAEESEDRKRKRVRLEEIEREVTMPRITWT